MDIFSAKTVLFLVNNAKVNYKDMRETIYGRAGGWVDVQENEREQRTTEEAVPWQDALPEECAELLQENAQLKQAYDEARSESTVYSHIALSLARGCTDLYYVNMDTDEFIEYHTDDDGDVLTEVRRGADFFEGCERDAKLYVHPDDQAAFVEAMNPTFLSRAFERTKLFELVYRRIKGDVSFYVRMRVSRMEDDERFIVIAVADIDEEVKQRRVEERIMEERTIYARLHALTGNFICVYVVEPKTGNYREFAATDDYVESFAQAKEGTDFFGRVRDVARAFNHPDDLTRFLSAFTQDNVLAEIERSGIFTLSYRLIMDGKPIHVQLKAAMVEEKEGLRLIVGLSNIDVQIRQQEEFGRRLAQAHTEASIDALTGVKNKHAYLETEARMDAQIKDHSQPPFAVTVLDVNNLKKVNDTEGHQAGDQHIRDACKIICNIFSHSPVFRTGGDEFAVISQGDDYEHIEKLLGRMNAHNAEAARVDGIVIACGMSRFDNDVCVAAVFDRADHGMYKNKNALKTAQSVEPVNKYTFSAEERTMLESLRQPFAVYQFIDKRVVTLLVSDGFCNLFGYTNRNDAVYDMDNSMYRDVHPDDVNRIVNATTRFATEGGKYEALYRTRKGEGVGYTVIRVLGEHVYTDEGVRLAHVWYTNEGPYSDASAEAGFGIADTLSSALYRQSNMRPGQYDELTGLPTMTYFFELVDAAKDAILEKGGQPALLYADFGGMKFFNTKHGFAEGNRILRLFARLLERTFGNENSCHIGEDHFAAIAEEDGLEEKLRRIFVEFEEAHNVGMPPVHVGIYPHWIEDVHASLACDRAKHACSTIKGSYSSDFTYYSSELREEVVMRQYIIESFSTAIRKNWIQVYLQPIIRSVNECVCDVEALARWIDPELGLLSPAVFIPVLEEAGLIYKLDLYVLEQVLKSIKTQMAEGVAIVPHSINLSRYDFDACDIVEEVCRRVDAAGIPRDRITIEITESVLGSDFEFMKAQVERFQQLGFPVWMDDFGSGYSSLDSLQAIKFDLIKFDMSFMRRLDESDSGKVIMTELMRMATSLGVGTLCEGVETEEQVRFLQEIGCSKLQGYYYSKPIPFETVRHMRRHNTLIETENPEESEYFENIGRVNLYDLGVIAQDDESTIQNAFDTLPMGVIEIKGDTTRFVRSNQTYRDFVKRFFGLELSRLGTEFAKFSDSFMRNVVKTCCEQGLRSFYDEKMPDGSIVHSFARRIGTNPVNGEMAVAVAVLSITEPDEETSYADIARALAMDYYNIYVIDLDTDTYVEYSSLVGGEELALERHGTDFFASARRDTMTRIYEGDRAQFLSIFTRENVIHELDTQGVFSTTYRLIDTDPPFYVNMKINRMQGSNRLILGVSNIDAQMQQQKEERRLRQERAALGRIAALSTNYIVLYTVDPVTEHYTQFNPSNEYEEIGLAHDGEDFFTDVVRDAPRAIDPKDMERHLRVFTKENVLKGIHENGVFLHKYGLLINGESVPVTLRATLIEEDDGEKILLGVSAD